MATAKAEIVKTKLGGDAELGAYLPDTSDAAVLTAAADRLAAKVKPAANVPPVQSEGGTPPARTPVDYSKLSAARKVEIGVAQIVGTTK